MAETLLGRGLGWIPDYADLRDHTLATGEVHSRRRASEGDRAAPVNAMMGTLLGEASETPSPTQVDLGDWFPPVEDQGELGSCTAQAGVGLVEYFERRAFGKHLDASRLFLYKVTRNLMQQSGDTGAFLRTTMGALAVFGVPPEKYYPYDIARFDDEPPAFCYSFAQSYQAIDYFRLDTAGVSPDDLLETVKQTLAVGVPAMFGFTVYDSIASATRTGEIPFPTAGDKVAGGHAVVAVGYDDNTRIGDESGAFKIRNSWGTDWGDDGYGWIPYRYVTDQLAVDWWSLLKGEWLDTGNFGRVTLRPLNS